MKHKSKITVVGSLNMDLVTITSQIPKQGETLLGDRFQMYPGGKGANQAVAAARLGAEVTMIGCLGVDRFGQDILDHMRAEGIIVTHVEPVTHMTATASIVVSDGDNRIIVVEGANSQVTAEFVEAKRSVIAESDMLIVQLEIPLDAVQKAVQIAKENGVKVILNPAPIQALPPELIEQVDYLTPNEHEEVSLRQSNTSDSLKEKLIVTRGSQGVTFVEGGEEVSIPSFRVEAVDTTGAGDAFNGGLAVSLGKGLSLREACLYANAVAALSVTKLGAQTGMPTELEVARFLESQNDSDSNEEV